MLKYVLSIATVLIVVAYNGCGIKQNLHNYGKSSSSTQNSNSLGDILEDTSASITPPSVFTTAKTIAATTTAKVLSWNLATELMGANYAGTFSITVQLVGTAPTQSYQFSNPVLTTGGNALHVKNISVNINSKLIATGTTYMTVDRYVAANVTTPRQLATGAMIIPNSVSAPAAASSVSIGFGLVETANFSPPTFTQLNSAAGVFGSKCLSCHGAAGGFAVNNYAQLTSGAKGIVIPFDPANSNIIKRLALMPGQAGFMPPGGVALTPAQFQQVRDWIVDGAPNN